MSVTVTISLWWLLWLYLAGLVFFVAVGILAKPWAVSPRRSRRDLIVFWSRFPIWPAMLIADAVKTIKFRRIDRQHRKNRTGPYAPYRPEYWEDA